MSEARVNNLSNESNTGGPTISGITTFSGTNYFVPPVGNTAQRPDNPQKGAIRFNTDSKHLEYYKGETIGWSEVEASHNQLGGGTGSNIGKGHRGLYGSGQKAPSAGTYATEIDFLTISTLGNAQDFGDMTESIGTNSAQCASTTRGIIWGGYPAGTNIDYITIASKGNATSFGTSTIDLNYRNCTSDCVRGVSGGGQDGPGDRNTIEYITIATQGDAVDFGDLTTDKHHAGACYSCLLYTSPSPRD